MENQKQERTDSTRLIHPRRPFFLTLMLWVFILWSVLGWLRFGRALVERSLIEEVANPGTFWYLILSGLFYGLVDLPVLWGIMRRASWVPTVISVLSILFPAVYWMERLSFWIDPSAGDNWPFMLALTVLWFGLVICVLNSKRGKNYFK